MTSIAVLALTVAVTAAVLAAMHAMDRWLDARAVTRNRAERDYWAHLSLQVQRARADFSTPVIHRVEEAS